MRAIWLSLAPWLVAGLGAQNVAWVATGIPDRNISGYRMTGVGDINQDGHEDLLMIVNGECTGLWRGFLWFLSGRDGTLLREVPCYNTVGCRFVSIAAAGDMSGDGVPDYCASQADYTSTWTEVRSGTNDAVIWSVPGVWDQLLSDMDVDGDSLRDLVVGDYRGTAFNYWGEMRAYSHGGALLYTFVGGVGSYSQLAIGNSLAAIGDVDNDGRGDFVMACLEATARGATVVVSGATGTILRTCYGELPGDGVGFQVTSCGDLDGDGYQDFAAGNAGNLNALRGVVRAFSGRTGQVLHQWVHQPTDSWATGMASRGVDLDGDGIADVLITQPYFYTGTNVYGAIYTFSGRDGSQLTYLTGQPPSAGVSGNVGFPATMLRPPQGTHTGLVVVANPLTLFGIGTTCGHNFGAIVAYQGLPRTAVTLGPACPGTLTAPPNIGMSALGSAGVRVHLSNAPPSAFAFLLLGLSTTQHAGLSLPAPLDIYGFPGCVLRTSIEVFYTGTAGSAGNEAGHVFMDLPYPVPTTGQGNWSLSAQWLVLGGGSTFPGGLSQAIRWQR